MHLNKHTKVYLLAYIQNISFQVNGNLQKYKTASIHPDILSKLGVWVRLQAMARQKLSVNNFAEGTNQFL